MALPRQLHSDRRFIVVNTSTGRQVDIRPFDLTFFKVATAVELGPQLALDHEPITVPRCVEPFFHRQPHALVFLAVFQVQVACMLAVHRVLVLPHFNADNLLCNDVKAVSHNAQSGSTAT